MLLTNCAPSNAQVQRMLIHGLVISESGQPIANANLKFVKSAANTSSSTTGKFTILKPMNTDTLEVWCRGYQVRKIFVNQHTRPMLKIILNKKYLKTEEERFALPVPKK